MPNIFPYPPPLPSAWPWRFCSAVVHNVTIRFVFSLVLGLVATLACHAQPPNSTCAGAALLCAEQPQTANNTGSPVNMLGGCPATGAPLWYSFTTNSQGGIVNVTVTNIDCPLISGTSSEINAVVLSGDGTCNLPAFVQASDCEQGNDEVTVTTVPLAANTRYWVVISGAINGMDTLPAQCDFALMLSGPGANIINVDVDAGPDVTIEEGNDTQLNGQVVDPTDFTWSPTSGLSGTDNLQPIASPVSTTIYSLSTTVAGCEFTDQVTVEVIRLINPPNTFTPNGDGKNDLWEIPGMADYPGAQVVIHDRWGQVVYRSTGYRDPWDGTAKGRPLSVGTYYYHIQLNQLEGRSPPYVGFVTIIR